MVLSVSGALLLGAVALFLYRKDGLKASHLIICALLGFYLASTSIAPNIQQSAASVADFLAKIRF